MFKGLLSNPEFLAGASIIGSRGNIGKGLLGYSQMQNAMTRNKLAEMQMQAMKQKQDQLNAQRLALGRPGGQVLDGPPDPGQTRAPVTVGTGFYSNNPADVARAQLDVIRNSPNVGSDLLKYQQAQNARKQRDFGKSPQWVRDRKTGEIMPVQFSNMGEAAIPGRGPVDPGKYEYLRPYTYQDIGGAVLPIPYGSNTPTGHIPKTLAPGERPNVKGAQAEATAAGKIKGDRDTTAAYDLPTITANANQAISHIDAMLSHPGLEYAVGTSSVLPVIPGTPAADYVTRLEQLQGGVFLEAYKSLKGGGQITEVEGKKAEQALARLARAQSEEEHKAALKEYRDIIYQGLLRSQKAGSKASTKQKPANSSGWTVREKQ